MEETTPDPPTTPAPPGAGASKPLWKRRLLLAAGALGVLLAVAAALLPAILSSAFARHALEGRASEASGRHVAMGDLSLGWSETRVRDLEVRWGPGEGDPLMARVGEVRVPAGISLAGSSRYDVGEIEVLRPEIRIDLRALAKEAPAAAAGPAGDGRPPAAPSKGKGGGDGGAPPHPFDLRVKVREGTLLVVGLDGKETRLGSFTADVAASSDGPAEVALSLDAGAGGKATLRGSASPFREGRPVAAAALEATVEAALEAFDLAPLREAAASLGDARLADLRGTVTGSLSARAAGKGNLEDGKAALDLRGFSLGIEDPAGGFRVDEPEVHLEGGLRRGKDGDLEVHEGVLRMKGLDLRASAGLSPARAVNGSLLLKASLAENAERAKRLGVRFEAWLQGEADIEARAIADGKGQRFSGTAGFRDVEFAFGPGRPTVIEPAAQAEFDLLREGARWTVSSASLRSETAEVRGSGTLAVDGSEADLRAGAKVRLGPALRIARAFGLALPGEVAGLADLDVRILRTGKEGDRATGTLVVTDLSVKPPGEGTREIREARLEAKFDAVPKKDLYEVRSVTLAGAGADLRAAGTASTDGAAGTLETCEATFDLEKAAALAGSFGAALPVRLAGAATWKGPLSWKGKGGEASAKGALRVRGLALTFPAAGTAPERTLREEEAGVQVDLDVAGKPGDLRATVRALDAAGAGLRLHAAGTFSEQGASDLALDGGGDVAALLGLAARAGTLEPVKDAAGTASLRGTVKAAGPGDPLRFALDAGVEGLRVPDPAGGAPWTQKAVTAALEIALDRKTRVATGTAVLRTDDGTATVRGTADLAEGRRSLDASADVDLDLGGFCRSRPDLLPLPGMSVGKAKGAVTLKGPLDTPLDPSKLRGTAKLALDSVKTEPLELRDAALDALLQGGTLTIQALTASVNGGKVSGTGALGFSGAEPKHFLEAKASGIRIDPAMEYLLVKVVPLFSVGEKGGVSGELRLDLRLDASGADWLSAKKSMAGKGSLAVADGNVTGSGFLGDLLELVGGGNGITFDSISTAFEVRDRKVWNDRLLVDGKEQALVFKGTTTFQGDLDYQVGIRADRLGKKVAERLAPVLDRDGNLVLEVRGNVSKPRVKAPKLFK